MLSGKASNVDMSEPRRIDVDGMPYTKEAFFEYYGSDDAWNKAAIYYPQGSISQKKSSSNTSKKASDEGLPKLPSLTDSSAGTSSQSTSLTSLKSSGIRTVKSFDVVHNGAQPQKESLNQKESSEHDHHGDKHQAHHHKHKHQHHKTHHHHHHHHKKRGKKEKSSTRPLPAVCEKSREEAGDSSSVSRDQSSLLTASDLYTDDDAEARKAFQKFDTDTDGWLDQVEVGNALAEVGIKLSALELDVVFAEYDVDGNNTLDFEEFKDMMGRQRAHDDSKNSLKEAFVKCDTDGSGTLELTELKSIMEEFGVQMDDGEVREMFEDADRDGSGAIDYNEFVEIMSTNE